MRGGERERKREGGTKEGREEGRSAGSGTLLPQYRGDLVARGCPWGHTDPLLHIRPVTPSLPFQQPPHGHSWASPSICLSLPLPAFCAPQNLPYVLCPAQPSELGLWDLIWA